jgi:hypothetical protein
MFSMFFSIDVFFNSIPHTLREEIGRSDGAHLPVSRGYVQQLQQLWLNFATKLYVIQINFPHILL